MVIKKSKKAESNQSFVGTWHIYKMSNWDEDYFNMETQAFIAIESDNTGEFQFGLVIGSLDGELSENRFTFTWDGQDEMDEANGGGWIQLIAPNEIEGEIKIHWGDSSMFKAKRVS